METRKHPNSTFFYPSSAITQIPRFLLASATHLYEKDISLGRKWVSTSSTTSHMDGWLVSHVNAAPYKGL